MLANKRKTAVDDGISKVDGAGVGGASATSKQLTIKQGLTPCKYLAFRYPEHGL
jgi:hypothetical protein